MYTTFSAIILLCIIAAISITPPIREGLETDMQGGDACINNGDIVILKTAIANLNAKSSTMASSIHKIQQIPTATNAFPNPQHLGCFADNSFTGIARPLQDHGRIPSEDKNVIIKECMKVAKQRGHNLFSIQDDNYCFTGTFESKGYMRDGKSTKCRIDSRGGKWANSVYKI